MKQQLNGHVLLKIRLEQEIQVNTLVNFNCFIKIVYI